MRRPGCVDVGRGDPTARVGCGPFWTRPHQQQCGGSYARPRAAPSDLAASRRLRDANDATTPRPAAPDLRVIAALQASRWS
jgi:hypothetical protein